MFQEERKQMLGSVEVWQEDLSICACLLGPVSRRAWVFGPVTRTVSQVHTDQEVGKYQLVATRRRDHLQGISIR